MGQRKLTEIKIFLDEKLSSFNHPSFIYSDPVSIPHLFSQKEDIEIAGFLTATIAWGQRPVILKNARMLMQWMDDAPHDFLLNFTGADLAPFRKFVHRTFNGTDCVYFLNALKNVYLVHGGLEKLFSKNLVAENTSFKQQISAARKIFFEPEHPARTRKHFSDPDEGSAAKRINMFLRWMVRKDEYGVDFGIWRHHPVSLLTCPLDVHSGRVARKLGLLLRKQNDWQAAEELTANLRKLDPVDPVKYDIALFGLGVFERFG